MPRGVEEELTDRSSSSTCLSAAAPAPPRDESDDDLERNTVAPTSARVVTPRPTKTAGLPTLPARASMSIVFVFRSDGYAPGRATAVESLPNKLPHCGVLREREWPWRDAAEGQARTRRNEKGQPKADRALAESRTNSSRWAESTHATPLGTAAPVQARPRCWLPTTPRPGLSFATSPRLDERHDISAKLDDKAVNSIEPSGCSQAMMTSSPSIESLSAAAGGATLAFDGTEGRMEKEAPIADAADRRIASFSSRSVLTDSSPTCVGGLFHGQQSTRVPESNEVRIVVTTVDDDASPGDGGCAAFGGLFGKCYEKADVNVDQEGASKDSEEPAEVEGSDIVDQDSNHE
ncbi:hypothetical protein THAOC_05442, partial [Thalassiosira oceanica]